MTQQQKTSRQPARRQDAAPPAQLPGGHASEKLVGRLAQRYGVAAPALLATLRDTVFRTGKDERPFSDVELAAALTLSEKYDLNPFAREIYVTRARGVLLVIVPIDGWAKIANRQEDYDGCEFEYRDRDGQPDACTCRIFRRSRSHATEVTEFYDECHRDTEPWNKWPRRMLRHKAFIQAVRLAFSLSEAVDDDEAARMGARIPEYTVRQEAPLPEPPRRSRPREIVDSFLKPGMNAPAPDESAAADEPQAPEELELPMEPDEDTADTKARKARLLEEWVFMRDQLSREEQDEVRAAAEVGLINTMCTVAQLEAVQAKASEIVQGKRA